MRCAGRLSGGVLRLAQPPREGQCVGRGAVQAAIGDGLSVDPFPFEEVGLPVSEVDISRGEIADALASVVVVGDPESGEITP